MLGKICLTAVCGVMLLCGSARAQFENSGIRWNNTPQMQRAAFIAGYLLGIQDTCEIYFFKNYHGKESVEWIIEKSNECKSIIRNNDNDVRKIDAIMHDLYLRAVYNSVPVNLILWAALKKIDGDSDKDIDAFLEEFRPKKGASSPKPGQ